ncbi:MAG: hypothetical protein GY852_11740, partial [bacterium]|nr:hypothetical protein [bacterium]
MYGIGEWLEDIEDLTSPYEPDIYSLHWYPESEYSWTYTFPEILDRAEQIVGLSNLLLGEFGYSAYSFSETSQADLFRNVLYYADQKGVVHLGAWTLLDFPAGTPMCAGKVPSPEEGQECFGLYRTDGSEKPAASVLKRAFQGYALSKTPMAVLNPSFENTNYCSNLMENWKPWDQNWTNRQTVTQDCTLA